MNTTAVFLDRDGVINEAVRGVWVDTPGQFKIYPYAAKAIGLLNKANIPVFIASNQSGIARGTLSIENHYAIMSKMFEALKLENAKITWTYICPHQKSPTICKCRKPQPAFVEQAIRDYQLAEGTMWMVGDCASDVEFAFNAKITPIIVRTGMCNDSEMQSAVGLAFKHNGDLHIKSDLLDACKFICYSS